MKNQKEKRLIIRRWIDLIVLSILSALIYVILHPIVANLSGNLAKLFPPSNIDFNFSIPIPIFVLLFLVTAFLWFLLIRLGGFRYRKLFPNNLLHSLKKAYLYPPTWLFAFFGAFLYYWIISLIYNTTRFDWSVIGLSIISFIPGIIFASFLDILIPFDLPVLIQPIHNCSNEKPTKYFRALLQDSSTFMEWLNKETPIQSSKDDLFDLAVFAKRIAMMLRATPLKTIAVVGSYGCGKSSIINMVDEYLKTPEGFQRNLNSTQDEHLINSDNIIICKVHGWGLQKNAAVEHILRSILSELSKSVDCLGLTNITDDYIVALSNSGSSWFKSFAVLSYTTREPLEILRRLDAVLTCSRKRMIIFLEDLERNTTGTAYWRELTSLLDRLKELDNISFVLAINQTSKKYDVLIRVCEHIEFIPALPRIEVLECIKFFRNICLDKYADLDIDCRTRDERNQDIGLKNRSLNYDITTMLGLEKDDPITVITKLLNNPRTLKSTLRHTLQSWKSLHGEIDYDDLLVARVIYTISPEAFAFINEYISLIRFFNTESTSEYTRERQEKNRKILEVTWQNIEGAWDSILVKKLIDFLFPGWIENSFYKRNVPQGVVHFDPTDYWSRLNREKLTIDEIPDQAVLHAVSDWKVDHSQSVYKHLNLSETILETDGFAQKIEHFGILINGHEIRSLAKELFELIRKEGGKIPKDKDINGFFQLWRLSLNYTVDEHEHHEWILGEIKKAIPVNLHFANELYYFWRHHDCHSVSMKNQTPELRNDFIEAARQVYQNNKKALIVALEPSYMNSTLHFMFYCSKINGDALDLDPNEWKWLIDVLIQAGKETPQVIVPQLVSIVVDEERTSRGEYQYSINEKRLDSLFGEEKTTVLKLLATEVDNSMFNEREKNAIEYIRQKAAVLI